MSIGEVLKQARAAIGLSQEEVAEKVGVSRQTISNWENGRSYPDISYVMALSDVYDLTLDSLLKGDSEMIKHLEESTNITKSNKQVAASIIALVVFLFGTVFTIVILGGYIQDFLSLPSLVLIVIPFVAILTITRSYKLFGIGFTALFPKKEIAEDVRKQAAMLFRLMSKTAIIAAAIITLISLINMMVNIDVNADRFSSNVLGNIAASLVPLLYGLIMSIFVFEPIAYILRKARTQ